MSGAPLSHALSLATVHGAAATEEKVGVILLCLLVALVLVAPVLAARRPARPGDSRASKAFPRIASLAPVAMLLALVLTPVLLAVDIWDTAPMRHLRHRPGLAAAAVVGGLLLVAVLTLAFRRSPRAFPLLAIFALPFRLPISSAGTTANLLVPLYLVVAAGALASLLPRLRSTPKASATASPDTPLTNTSAGAPDTPLTNASALPPDTALTNNSTDAPDTPLTNAAALAPDTALTNTSNLSPDTPLTNTSTLLPHPTHPRNGVSGRLAAVDWPALLQAALAASLLLYALQAAYSADFSKALQNIVFFYVPFSLLFALLREVRWSKSLLLQCAGVLVVLSLLFAGVGFVEYQRKALFLNPKVVAANHFDTYFRVNSVFFDPNIYGRFLALVMLILATGVLWAARRRQAAFGALALAWLWAGLITSFSQSSIAALLLGLAVLAAYRWDALSTVYITSAGIAIGIVILFTAPPSLHLGLTGPGGSANNATSGRAGLVEGGLQLFADRPIYGFGSGSFATEYTAHRNATTASATSASHTIPITVAAEQGLLGLLLYVLLLVAALFTLLLDAGRSPPRIAIAACFVALLLHTMAYADFLEDPFTWALLGIGVALATVGRRSRGALDLEEGCLASAAPRAAAGVPARG